MGSHSPKILRRRLLQCGAAIAVGVAGAGCNTDNPGDGNDTDTTSTSEDPGTTTTGEDGSIQLDIQNSDIEIVWSPDINQREEIPDEHTPQGQVTTSGNVSLGDVNVILENGDETRELEPDSNGNLELPANQLQEGETTAYATNGSMESNQETVSKQIPNGFRADVKIQDGQHSSDWETVYAFDDTPFSQSDIDSMRESWVDETAYNGFVSAIRADEDFDDHYLLYPRGGGDGRKFHLDEFKDGDFLTALKYVATAARDATKQRYNGPPSGHAYQMAASAEKAMDEVHPDYTTRGWGFRNPKTTGGGHGTMMFYDETNGEWWHAETVNDNVVKPEDALVEKEETWSPFTSKDAEMPGFHPGESQVEGINYFQKSKNGITHLFPMVENAQGGVNFDKVFITDTWMDDAYEHIRADGDIEPILEPLEEMVYGQIESEEYVGLYGDLDDSRMVKGGDLGDMYEKVMHDSEVMTTDKIESRLAS